VEKTRNGRVLTDFQFLILLAVGRMFIHILTNNQYGFHRDALAFLENGQHLAWGYIEYPPLTPFIGRLGLELFGLSLVGIKSLAALAQSIGMVLTGLIVRELGGNRWAQAVAALAAAISIMSLLMSTLFQYISFDYLWWVFTIYCLVRLLKSEDSRWWLGIGCSFGFGMLTKYTMVFLVLGLVVAVLLTPLRAQLRSPWLWGGVALSLLIFWPNLVWQIQHEFISLEFLTAIRTRDIEIGRADGFLLQQLYVNINPLTIPLFLMGLGYYFFSPEGKRFRAVGWIYLVCLLTFGLSQGRFYYLAPAYPMMLAGGTVWLESWLNRQVSKTQRLVSRLTFAFLIMGGVIGTALALPIPPVNSALWNVTSDVHDNFVEQIGWDQMVQTVSAIYRQAADKQTGLGVLAANYGEVGALNLYGPQYGLPTAISPVNSFWFRGYDIETPNAVIALGFSEEELSKYFTSCTLAGKNQNSFGVENEESRFAPDIYLCEGLEISWEEFWLKIRSFG
jgi:4-amino-4-deoxy-L-arabinose transferase-like glycosyltransferase